MGSSSWPSSGASSPLAGASPGPGGDGPAPWAPAFTALLPHAPILIPDVGRRHLAECRATHDACVRLAERLVAARPDRMVLVSPHAPRSGRGFGLWSGELLRGTFADFGAREASVQVPNDEELVRVLSDTSTTHGADVWHIPGQPLDHGSLVPLWFLAHAGWNGPTTIASLPGRPAIASLRAFGRAVAATCETLGGRTALLASGDMTHRALPGAPAGYHPDAVELDRALVALVESGQLDRIPEIDQSLRELAAEDATDSATVVAAASGFRNHGHEVLSYEHPFGVGYMVAVFDDGDGQ